GFRVHIRTIDTFRPLIWVKIRTGPEHDPVGIGTGRYGAMVGIGYRKGFRQGILKGNLLPGVIGHGERGLVQGPITILALVPSGLHIRKIVRGTFDQRRIGRFPIGTIWRDYPLSVRLIKYPLSVL